MSQPYRWPSLSERKSYLVSLLFFHGSICAVEESFYLHFLPSQFLKDKSWKTIGCMRQSILEWTRENLWKTQPLKNLKGYGLPKQTISLHIF